MRIPGVPDMGHGLRVRIAFTIPGTTIQHEMPDHCPGGRHLVLIEEGKKTLDLLTLR
jgi:hypothetical protein